MIYETIFHPAFETDVEYIIDYYEHRLAGLGSRFLKELDEKIQTIILNPEIFKIKLNTFRWATLDVFPFKVVFKLVKSKIYFLAVLHCKRKNSFLRRRRI